MLKVQCYCNLYNTLGSRLSGGRGEGHYFMAKEKDSYILRLFVSMCLLPIFLSKYSLVCLRVRSDFTPNAARTGHFYLVMASQEVSTHPPWPFFCQESVLSN